MPDFPPWQRPSCTEPLLIGTDGRATADAAFQAGGIFANHLSADVQVVSVLEPQDVAENVAPGVSVLKERDTLLTLAIQTQMALRMNADTDWPITILNGPLGPSIQQVAQTSQARLIVVGKHPHSLLGRTFGQDSTIRILQGATTPVYLAANTMRNVPQRAVVGIDFSRESLLAAHVAQDLLSRNGILYLVHVCASSPGIHSSQDVAYNLEEARSALADVRKSIRLHTAAQIQSIVLFGRPETELLAFADGVHADLIACGTRLSVASGPLYQRLSPGSVTVQLIDHSQCSIVVVPSCHPGA